jgi:hypothetical protein
MRQPVGERHVKIGPGRDYDDVLPLRGVYHGKPEHGLGVTVQITRERLSAVAEQCQAPSVAGQCRAPSVAGQCRAPSVAGQCRAPSVAGQCRAPSVAEQCRAPSVAEQSLGDTSPTCGGGRALTGRALTLARVGQVWDRLLISPAPSCDPAGPRREN